jgi:hypothetical protein
LIWRQQSHLRHARWTKTFGSIRPFLEIENNIRQIRADLKQECAEQRGERGEKLKRAIVKRERRADDHGRGGGRQGARANREPPDFSERFCGGDYHKEISRCARNDSP